MHAKALSSPPSSFHTNSQQASSRLEPSLSGSSSSLKRQSMNTGSSSGGPRPLHLALGSVVSPSVSSPSTSSLGGGGTGHVEGNEGQILTSKRDSVQSASSSHGQPLSPTVASLRKETMARKRSSITYIPSTPNSPSYLPTNRLDSPDNFGATPSPLSSSYARAAFLADGKGSGLVRTSSLGRKGTRTPRSATFNERASTGSFLENSDPNIADAKAHLKERPPVTLNEKHADLLHFIAQKESKCLELRSQLAVHEAELLQLKRKWEKIVNRGFEKALSPNAVSTTSLTSVPSSFPPESSSPNSAGYFPTLHPNNTNAPATVVLEGIKESVQGMSRLIVAGLGSIAQVNAAPDHPNPQTACSNANAPLPLRLGSVPQWKTNDSGHGQTESQSSSSTTMSGASNVTSSSFLSASTTSSATSAASSSSMTDSTTKKSGTSDVETESEFGEFAEGQTRQRSATLTEHLIVEDTGATPMMSPNPRFQRRKLRVDDASLSSVSASSSTDARGSGETGTSSKDDFDWDEGWDEPLSDAQMNDLFLDVNATKKAPASSAYPIADALNSRQSRTHEPANGMSPSSPTQSPQQMNSNSWVGSVGKKWGEIKGSPTFTKNQKRASVLLSDIQQTFVTSLISASAASDSSSSKPGHPTPTTPSSQSALSSNSAHKYSTVTPSPRIPAAPNSSNAFNPQPTRRSLIDDSDDESFGESAEETIKSNLPLQMPLAARMMSSSVMVPDSTPQTLKSKAGADKSSKTGGTIMKVDDDDEWNW